MRTTHSVPRWRPLLDAALITLFVLALFFHWFGLANRYVLFLYGHSAPGIPLTQPFDAMTASRYWMSGLVAAGAVLERPAADMPWGDRMGTLRDPFGHVWHLTHHIEDVPPEEITRRMSQGC